MMMGTRQESLNCTSKCLGYKATLIPLHSIAFGDLIKLGGVVWKSFLNWLSHPSEKVGKLFLCKVETGS